MTTQLEEAARKRCAAKADAIDLIVQRWVGRDLLAWSGYFPNDFYGKMGEQYYKAVKAAATDLRTIAADLREPFHATPQGVEEHLGWCDHCGEGVTDFCRGNVSPCPNGLRTLAAAERPKEPT